VLDFTSSLYLGFQHGASSLPAWRQLTLGKPAALEDPPGASRVEHELAALTGCEAAVLAPSTLHIFVDLIPMLAGSNAAILVDRDAYRMAWWGIEQASARGVKQVKFGPHDPQELAELAGGVGARPIVVTDGLSVESGQPAPIRDYAQAAARHRGVLVIDDTQALGINGTGGGGSLREAGLRLKGAMVVNSLAKGFGVPVAMLGGSAKLIAMFRRRSLTRMHCSPPSVAAIAAAARALEMNRRRGDALRSQLARRVAYFNRGLETIGIHSNGSLFPVRPLKLPKDLDARGLNHELERRGVRTVLNEGPRGGASLNFVIRASHKLPEIDTALDALADAIERLQYTGR
jgi:8-amino-7-oxononanoate synthase